MKCGGCGTEIPDSSNYCPQCGIRKQGLSGGMPENIAGLLAYITFIPAVIFLLIEPYNKNNFVRFHAFQSIFFTLASMVIQVALHMMGSFMSIFALALIPIYGFVGLGFFILWIVCLVKAFNHEKFKIPIIGEWADQQAG